MNRLLLIVLLPVVCAASSASAATFIRAPYPQAATSSSVILRWRQSGGAASVRLTSAGSARTAKVERDLSDAATADGEHTLAIDKLQPGTRYRYEVTARDAAGTNVASGEFSTAAPAGRPFTFLVYGDNRTWDGDHQTVVTAMAREAAEFAVNTGDIVSHGSAGEFEKFFAIEAPLLARTVLFPALGNHELAVDPDGVGWQRFFSTPRAKTSAAQGANQSANQSAKSAAGADRYYSFDWGDARFIVLDFNRMTSTQNAWLESTLADARQRGLLHIFTFMHHGPFDSGEHGENDAAQAAWVPLFKKYGVDVIFSGHDHDYERGEDPMTGLRYVVSGGGGAPIYGVNRKRSYQQRFVATLHYVRVEVSGARVEITALRPDGTVIDRFSVTSPAASSVQPLRARSAPAHH